MINSASPKAIARAAWPTASSPEAHSRLTVQAGHCDRQARQQHGHAGDVAVVLAGLVGAAEDDFVDRGRIERGMAFEQAPERQRGQIVGPDRRQTATKTAERRAQAVAEIDRAAVHADTAGSNFGGRQASIAVAVLRNNGSSRCGRRAPHRNGTPC